MYVYEKGYNNTLIINNRNNRQLPISGLLLLGFVFRYEMCWHLIKESFFLLLRNSCKEKKKKTKKKRRNKILLKKKGVQPFKKTLQILFKIIKSYVDIEVIVPWTTQIFVHITLSLKYLRVWDDLREIIVFTCTTFWSTMSSVYKE